MRALRRVWAAVGLLVLVVGVPVALVDLAGWPLPRRLPESAELRRWLARPLSVEVVTAAAVVVGWLLWGGLLYAVAADLVARLTRLRLPRLRLATPMQTMAGGLVGAIVVGTVGAPASAAAPSTAASSTHGGPADVGRHAGAGHRGPVRVAASGVDLGEQGWLRLPIAAAVGALVTRLWLHRRRRYHPDGAIPATGRPDRDLTPVPWRIAAVLHRLAEATTGHGVVPADLPDPVDLPAGGVALVGPGAVAAARGLLAGRLVTDRPRPQHGQPCAVVTATAWRHLFAAAAAPTVAGLHLAGDGHDAATACRTATARGGDPPLILVDPAEPTVSAELVDASGPVVALGRWPGHPTWYVHRDGTLTTHHDTAIGRLSILSAALAGDILTLLHDIDTVVSPPPPQPESLRGNAPTPAAVTRTAGLTPHDDVRLHVRLLGGVQLTDRHGQPVRLGRHAALELLIMLILQPAVHAETAQAALWPAVARHVAVRRLHTTVSELRRAIRPIIPGAVVIRVADRYRLRPESIDVDVWQLLAAHHRAAAATDPPTRHQALQDLVHAYTGELAPDHTAAWLNPPRETLRRHLIDALTALADADPDPARTLARLHQAIGHDPYNEQLYQRAMHAHAALDDPHGVTHTLTQLTRRLGEIDTLPDPATTQLATDLTTGR